MPDRSLTVATYAAGASLAAITLIYVFAPTYFLDNDQSSGGGVLGSRKKGIVGLHNPANDCFINSILQALAGLNDLRLYLIQETHRRSVGGNGKLYARIVRVAEHRDGETTEPQSLEDSPDWKMEGLQMGIVTKGLKEILDALNERPIYKKTISAAPFIRTLEVAFRQRISRQQQDAQEFLQVVAERLCDEYHAGSRVRRLANGRTMSDAADASMSNGEPASRPSQEDHVETVETAETAASSPPLNDSSPLESAVPPTVCAPESDKYGQDEGFPLEGKFESQIECLTCGFKPRPTESTFCTLTLNVPQVSSTTLAACFDGMFKTEYIDDFKCEKCRLLHARDTMRGAMAKLESNEARESALADLAKLQDSIDTDPEKPPVDVALLDIRQAPRRKIARHIRLTHFPRILAVHLSRSIFDASSMSQKNLAKVAFPERLPLGGLLSQRRYTLRGLVTHKGSHYSGHYETFRRQTTYPPFSNPGTFQPSSVYGSPSGATSTIPSRSLEPKSEQCSPVASAPDLPSSASETGWSTTSVPRPTKDTTDPVSLSLPDKKETDTGSLRSAAVSMHSAPPRLEPGPVLPAESRPLPTKAQRTGHSIKGNKAKSQKASTKWWRISDEKVKGSSIGDVLGMQKEVYLLFYELDR
ncbi:cysteine proteinase [Podospora conica]|nr:cysteine proteinase [Schizothecium conicum]